MVATQALGMVCVFQSHVWPWSNCMLTAEWQWPVGDALHAAASELP